MATYLSLIAILAESLLLEKIGPLQLSTIIKVAELHCGKEDDPNLKSKIRCKEEALLRYYKEY